MMKRLLFINRCIRGSEGNTGELLGIVTGNVQTGVETHDLVLATYDGSLESLAGELRIANGFLVGTGVCWARGDRPCCDSAKSPATRTAGRSMTRTPSSRTSPSR